MAENTKKDCCIRGTAANGQIRFWVASSTNLVEEAFKRHGTCPIATIALGRTLTVVAMMGLMLKNDNETMTVRISGSGELGSITATGTNNGQVRGYVQNSVVNLSETNDSKVNVGNAVGLPGYLYVIKDMKMKHPYTGSIPLVSGEIAEDIAQYFTVSEQTPSAVGLGVCLGEDNTVTGAGGYIIQLMPDADLSLAAGLEANIEIMPSLSTLFAQGATLKDITSLLMLGFDWQELSVTELSFACDCSRERLYKVLTSLGKEELTSLLAEQGHAEVVCSFCGEKYMFSGEEIQTMIAE